MIVYKIGAGGYRASGMAIVAANSPERATEMANWASQEKAAESGETDYELTYHSLNATPVDITERTNEAVIALHEYGSPELPSKGSGIKVTF